MDKRIETIAKHYGYERQKMQLIEKIGGLMQAVSEYDRAEDDYEAYATKWWLITDKLVDVQIMIDQFRALFGVLAETFEVRYNDELERQMKRIEDEQLVWIINAAHKLGGTEYSWRVPKDKEVPEVGEIVYVHAKGKVKPVIVQGVRKIKGEQAKGLKEMAGEANE